MSAQTLSKASRIAVKDWKFAVAVGFLALTCLGAAMDRRGAILDRTVVASRSAERSVVPLTTTEQLAEMLTHD